MKAFGNIRLVTRTCALRSLIWRSVMTRKLAHDLGHRHVGVDRGVAEQLAVAFLRILVVEEAMQERGVRRIDAHFERLQPVAVDGALEREGVAVGRDEAVEVRKLRRLARPHVGEQDAAPLHHRVGLLPDVGAEVRAVRLGWSLQALAGGVEQPAVEGAAQAAALEAAVSEVGATMRATALDQAVTAFFVAEQHQVLAEELHRLDRAVGAGKLVDQRHRLPVAAEKPTGRRAGADAGDEVVLFLAEHGRRSLRL